MRKITLLALGVMVFTTAFAGAAMAQYSPPAQPATQPATPAPATTQTQGQYPNVANLKPFAAEANFMSLAGYLRYLVFQQTSQWLTREEAVRIVNQQHGM
ncbi:MAG TPA: hypothetical protein VFL28_10690 [bacterium]|nr:hypothetical protein [bacterium]